MSLAIVFKGADGIVLAADSRVTLTNQQKQGNATIISTSTFDNATKLFGVNGNTNVGVVTWGLGGINPREPRTVHSLMPEFESPSNEHATVESVAQKLRKL